MNPYTVSPYLRILPLEPAQAAGDLRWQDFALCAEIDPELWFPEKGGSTAPAKSVCRACEVRAECLEYALEHEDISAHGIWGGVSERDRRRLQRGEPVRGTPPPAGRPARPALEDYPLCAAGLHRQTPNNVCVNLKTGGRDCKSCRNMTRVSADEQSPQPRRTEAA